MVMIQCNGNNGNNDIVGSNNEIIMIVMVFWKVQRTDESQVTLSKLWPAAWLGGRAGTKSANRISIQLTHPPTRNPNIHIRHELFKGWIEKAMCERDIPSPVWRKG